MGHERRPFKWRLLDDFCYAPVATEVASRRNMSRRANSRLMRRGKSRPMDQPVYADEHGSFGQPRFAKTLNHQLRIN
jgi:hypothetical protein